MPAPRPYRLHRRFARLQRDLDPPPGDLDRPRGARVRRFDSLPRRLVTGHEVPVAVGRPARTLGLALLDRADAGPGLLIPRCAAVHTFGMRFPLDVYFLGAGGEVLSARRAVPPRRFVSHRGAAAVLEVPA